MNHLLDFKNMNQEEASKILETTTKIDGGEQYQAQGHTVIKFEEPSTRTKVSFTIAAQKLGLELILLEDEKLFNNYFNLYNKFFCSFKRIKKSVLCWRLFLVYGGVI